MNTATRLGMFAAVLAIVFGGAFGVGAIAGPEPVREKEAEHGMAGDEMNGHNEGGQNEGGHNGGGPGGLAVSAEGFTFRRVAAAPGEFAFQILDAKAQPVTRYQISHEKRLHLVVVRRDLTGFRHVHPAMDPDGTWRIPLTLAEAGDWRAFADFLPEGRDRQVILGLDVPVAGDYRPQPLPPPTTISTVDDYRVTVDGHLTAGRTSRLTLTVTKNNATVTDLQPYLGALGHLVALRDGDLGYLHVHPQSGTTFDVEVPTAGSYRLFLDFRHGDVVRTASFTVVAT